MPSTWKKSLIIKSSNHSTRTHSTNTSCRYASVVLVFGMLLQIAHTRSTGTLSADTAATSAAIAAGAGTASNTISAATTGVIAAETIDIGSQNFSMRQKLSIETNSIQRHVVEGNSNTAEQSHNRSLKRVFLSNRTITCNDGSQAGFYLRKNPNSKKWIVFLEGGWHCYDMRSCRARWLRLRHLMTSAQWPETRDVGGILSPLQDENPYWHNANHVLVPYCSSDSWSGTRSVAETQENNWRFMGALILRQVIADLIPLGLGRATGAELLLVGSSAGGLGVMLNLDRITNFLLHERNLMVTVRGVSDSGWFLDREPYTPAAVGSSDAVRQGWKLWQGLLPDACTKQHSTEPWRCYFGYRLYPTLISPLFVFQWLFDEAQMRADNVGAPVTPQQWNYIHEMGGALRSSLDNVTAVFAPSCIGHAVLSKRDWVNIKIDDISLPAALRCWEHSTRPRRKRHDKLMRATEATILASDKKRHRNGPRQQRKHRNGLNKDNSSKSNDNNSFINGSHNDNSKSNRIRLTKEQRKERKQRRHERQKRRKENRNRHHHRKHYNSGTKSKDHGNELPNMHPENVTIFHDRKQKNHQRNNNNTGGNNFNRGKLHAGSYGKRKRKNHQQHHQQQQQQQRQPHEEDHQKNNQNESQNIKDFEHQFQQEQPVVDTGTRKQSINDANSKRRNHIPRVPEKCSLRLLERCSWPQCNHSCPTLTNPLTGEEMRFLELLTSFGLDIEAVAAALGVDMHTLNNMDRTELVNLLTQQVS